MNILRKIVVGVALVVLPAALFSFGLLLSFYLVFGSPDRIKQALSESGVYEAAIAQLAQEPKGPTDATTPEEVPAGQQVMQKAVRDAIPPAYLEQETGNMLDGIYAWLRGEKDSIAFEVKLEPIKEKLVTSITEQARERAGSLPACAPGTPISSDYDVFNTECLPAGLPPEVIADQTRQKVLESELFKDTSLTADDLQGDDGKTLESRLTLAATAYDGIRKGIVTSSLTALASLLIVISLSKPRRLGIRRVSITFISVGSVTVVLTFIGNLLVKGIATGFAESSKESIQARLAEFVHVLANDLRPLLLGFGILLVLAGIGALITLHFTKPQPGAGQGPALGTPMPRQSGRQQAKQIKRAGA
ncbi:MAG TPA: hypothetical protein VFM05_02500 [Candidatus Saccharimonadales bacterium]|nr:hypothetical protein [Candidatus Saccharimonadales bacterium]